MINVASRPFYQVADRILGSQFLQDIAEFFLNFQSMYGGFVERAQVGRAAAARSADDVRGRHHARGRAAPRGRAVLRGADETRLPPRRARAQQDAARVSPVERGRAGGRRSWSATARRSGASSRPRGDPALADPRSRPRGVLRTLGDSFRNYEVVAEREAELRDELAAPPRGRRERADLRLRHRRRRRARPDRRPSLRLHAIRDGPGETSVAFGGEAVCSIAAVHETKRPALLRRGAAPRAAAGGVVAAARRPLLLRPPVARPRGSEDRQRFVILAQVRPTTGQTAVPHRPRGLGRRRGSRAAPRDGVAQRRDRRGRRAGAGVDRARPRAVHPRSLPASRSSRSSRARRGPRSVGGSGSSSTTTSRSSTGSPT